MTSIRPTRPTRPTPRKVKELTLEEQLSALRSQTSLWNIGTEVTRLENLIQKKRMIL